MAERKSALPGRRAHVALFDATSLVAKGVKDQLVSRRFPTASVRLFTSSDDPDANLSEFAGEAMLVTAPDIDTLGNLDIAFLCGTEAETKRYLDWPGPTGFTAIDLTSAARGLAGVPLVNASVNPDAIGGPGVIATPQPAAQILSSVIDALKRGPGVRDAAAVVFQPASERGNPGIDELYQQSVGLLNFQDLPKVVFGRQLAFNLIPREGGAEVEGEVKRITGPGYTLAVQLMQAPVFHGHALALRVALGEGGTRARLLEVLGRSPDLRIAAPGDAVTPVERAGQAGIMVADVRPTEPSSAFWIWAVADDLAGGSALNAVRIAETLLERGLVRGAA